MVGGAAIVAAAMATTRIMLPKNNTLRMSEFALIRPYAKSHNASRSVNATPGGSQYIYMTWRTFVKTHETLGAASEFFTQSAARLVCILQAGDERGVCLWNETTMALRESAANSGLTVPSGP